jgi:hypothetical protein
MRKPRVPSAPRPIGKISLVGLLVVSACLINAKSTMAQDLTVQEWVDQFVTSCVGSGSSDTASGEVGANGDISLKRLALSGTVKGQVQIAHKEARLLTEGINNAMTMAAVGAADQIRQCLSPLRAILAQIMQSQFQGSMGAAHQIYILTPEEDAIIKVLAGTKGHLGKIGQAVLVSTIQSETGLGDIRYNAAMRRLLNRGYAVGVLDTADLLPNGEDYALSVGFAK